MRRSECAPTRTGQASAFNFAMRSPNPASGKCKVEGLPESLNPAGSPCFDPFPVEVAEGRVAEICMLSPGCKFSAVSNQGGEEDTWNVNSREFGADCAIRGTTPTKVTNRRINRRM